MAPKKQTNEKNRIAESKKVTRENKKLLTSNLPMSSSSSDKKLLASPDSDMESTKSEEEKNIVKFSIQIYLTIQKIRKIEVIYFIYFVVLFMAKYTLDVR